MEKIVIIINGAGGAGKDTLCVNGKNLLQLFNLCLMQSIPLIQAEIRHSIGPFIGKLHITLVDRS